MNIPGYDQWKTASPYDENPDDTHCINCGAFLPEDEPMPDYVFEGFCCDDCEAGVEKTNIMNEPQKAKRKELFVRLEKAKEISRNKPITSTIEEIFKDAPEGNFKWEGEAGDNHAWCCGIRDCQQQWHECCYVEEMGRRDGKRYFEVLQGDVEGNYQPNVGWEEGEDPSELLYFLAHNMDDFFIGWTEYWLDASVNGEDVLKQCTKPEEDIVTQFLKFAEEEIKYLEM